MSDYERTMHLGQRDVHIADHWITQDMIDGLNALIHWLQGFEAATDSGRIPGHFELVMYYRSLMSQIHNKTIIEASKEDFETLEEGER